MSFSSDQFSNEISLLSATTTDDKVVNSNLYDFLSDMNENQVVLLTRIWMNERNAPELLPYRKQLVDNLIDVIEKQASVVMDEMASTIENKFISMLYQTEMERVRYVIKSYLRTRLFKIEKYTLELLRNPNYAEIMSPQEIVYARRYQELVEKHNHDSFVQNLPVTQHKQDEKTAESNMIVSANLEAPVFCKILEPIGEIQWLINDETETTDLDKGGTYIIRYRAIQQYLQDGRVQLI